MENIDKLVTILEHREQQVAAGHIGKVVTERIAEDGVMHQMVRYVPKVSLSDMAEAQPSSVDSSEV